MSNQSTKSAQFALGFGQDKYVGGIIYGPKAAFNKDAPAMKEILKSLAYLLVSDKTDSR